MTAIITPPQKPKQPCVAVVTCPTCKKEAHVFKFTLDQGAARWMETAYHFVNNVCTNLCGTPGKLTIRVHTDGSDAAGTDFDKESFFEYFYKQMYNWCDVPGCEEKFYKEGSRGHHLCTEHYEQGLKIDAQHEKDKQADDLGTESKP